MEGDKEAYLEEASKALKRQRANIHELELERRQLNRSLRVSRSKQNRNKDAENAAKIARLAEDQDTITIMIKREKQALKDLEGEINRIERQIAQQRKSANNAGKSGDSAPQTPGGGMTVRDKKDIGKKIVLLENRLDGVMIRYYCHYFYFKMSKANSISRFQFQRYFS